MHWNNWIGLKLILEVLVDDVYDGYFIQQEQNFQDVFHFIIAREKETELFILCEWIKI